MTTVRLRSGVGVASAAAPTLLLSASPAAAQAPINSNVALQPSPGQFILRQQFRYAEGDAPGVDATAATASTTGVYGLTSELTLLVNAPFVLERRLTFSGDGTDTDAGVADLTALGKLRFHRNDFGPTQTSRADLLFGAEFPTGTSEFTSDSVDPIVGGVYTLALKRNYFSADVLWQFNTAGDLEGDDRLRYDVAWVYRLWPERYTGPNPAGLNFVLEANGAYWTSGENELFISPGLQYVTRRWIVEATVQAPVWQDLDDRLETDFVVGVGVRLQF